MDRKNFCKSITEGLEIIRFSIRRIPFVDDLWTIFTERITPSDNSISTTLSKSRYSIARNISLFFLQINWKIWIPFSISRKYNFFPYFFIHFSSLKSIRSITLTFPAKLSHARIAQIIQIKIKLFFLWVESIALFSRNFVYRRRGEWMQLMAFDSPYCCNWI